MSAKKHVDDEVPEDTVEAPEPDAIEAPNPGDPISSVTRTPVFKQREQSERVVTAGRFDPKHAGAFSAWLKINGTPTGPFHPSLRLPPSVWQPLFDKFMASPVRESGRK